IGLLMGRVVVAVGGGVGDFVMLCHQGLRSRFAICRGITAIPMGEQRVTAAPLPGRSGRPIVQSKAYQGYKSASAALRSPVSPRASLTARCLECGNLRR